MLVASFEECVKMPTDEERLRRMLEVVSVACSVRQGSRMTRECHLCQYAGAQLTPLCPAKHLKSLLSQIPTFPLTSTLHPAVLKFSLSTLIAGDMALWAGPGRIVLLRAFDTRPVLALELCGALAELGWGGWRLLALPSVLKWTGELLGSMPGRMLELLAALEEGGRLEKDVVDVVWRKRVMDWVERRFGEWEFNEENVSDGSFDTGVLC